MRYLFTKGINEDSKYIRTIVFIDEQNFKEEFDENDKTALTLVIYNDNDIPMATGRLLKCDNKTFKLGRIAVLKEYRKLGLGSIVITQLENKGIEAGAKVFYISAQVVAKEFYSKCGYTAFGDTYFEEHVEHIGMYKKI